METNHIKCPIPLPKTKHMKKKVLKDLNVFVQKNYGKDWDDGFTTNHIPEYKVYEDKYC